MLTCTGTLVASTLWPGIWWGPVRYLLSSHMTLCGFSEHPRRSTRFLTVPSRWFDHTMHVKEWLSHYPGPPSSDQNEGPPDLRYADVAVAKYSREVERLTRRDTWSGTLVSCSPGFSAVWESSKASNRQARYCAASWLMPFSTDQLVVLVPKGAGVIEICLRNHNSTRWFCHRIMMSPPLQ